MTKKTKMKVENTKDVIALLERIKWAAKKLNDDGVAEMLITDEQSALNDHLLIQVRKKLRETLAELNERLGNDEPDKKSPGR